MSQNNLQNKRILLGVTGCIAAYKSAELIRLLKKSAAEVKVVMTEAAKEFIMPLTLQTLSQQQVYSALFEQNLKTEIGHISLARWADLILIAPASANYIARLAHGLADDLLATVCLATKAPIALAPAMNCEMWHNSITQQNVAALRLRKVKFFGPSIGALACEESGVGRMLEPVEILVLVNNFFAAKILRGKRILITAGATREAIDPIRFISNYSSGKMGYALAEAAANLGAKVVLISAMTNLPCPIGVERIEVLDAREMYSAVMQKIATTDIFISAAAVADYRVAKIAKRKIKKSYRSLSLKLVPNVDILASVAKLRRRPLLIGFAAETEDLLKNARKKLKQKDLDIVVANLISSSRGFNSDENEVQIVSEKGKVLKLPLADKSKIATGILNFVAESLSLFTV